MNERKADSWGGLRAMKNVNEEHDEDTCQYITDLPDESLMFLLSHAELSVDLLEHIAACQKCGQRIEAIKGGGSETGEDVDTVVLLSSVRQQITDRLDASPAAGKAELSGLFERMRKHLNLEEPEDNIIDIDDVIDMNVSQDEELPVWLFSAHQPQEIRAAAQQVTESAWPLRLTAACGMTGEPPTVELEFDSRGPSLTVKQLGSSGDLILVIKLKTGGQDLRLGTGKKAVIASLQDLNLTADSSRAEIEERIKSALSLRYTRA
jgi:hypothetical protein